MILQLQHLSKRFGGIKAISDCSLSIEQGKITALIGPNGSGKTTLFNLISKLLTPEKGKISLAHKDITSLPDFKVAKKGLSRTFQQVRLFHNLTIRDHFEIVLNKIDESVIESFFSKEKNNLKRIQEILDLVGLEKELDTLASNLSYGQRKLLDLALAIAQRHYILLLDEPVAGVNPKLRKRIKEIILDLNKEGETILVIEHDMNFVMDLADHVFVLDAGQIIAEGRPKDIQNNPKVLDAYLGE